MMYYYYISLHHRGCPASTFVRTDDFLTICEATSGLVVAGRLAHCVVVNPG